MTRRHFRFCDDVTSASALWNDRRRFHGGRKEGRKEGAKKDPMKEWIEARPVRLLKSHLPTLAHTHTHMYRADRCHVIHSFPYELMTIFSSFPGHRDPVELQRPIDMSPLTDCQTKKRYRNWSLLPPPTSVIFPHPIVSSSSHRLGTKKSQTN